MKVFVTGKAGEEHTAREAMQLLRQAGHEITFDWTTIPHLKPYDKNIAESRQAAILEAKGVLEADIVVLIAHEKGVGMYVELGMAIAKNKPVYVIGNITPTMFLFHPIVTRVKNMTEVLRHLKNSLRNLRVHTS